MKKNAGNGPKQVVVRLNERELGGPRSLTRVLGLFDALAKKADGLTLADLNSILVSFRPNRIGTRSFCPIRRVVSNS